MRVWRVLTTGGALHVYNVTLDISPFASKIGFAFNEEMEGNAYVLAHYKTMSAYGNIFTVFEEELAKGNPEVTAIVRDLEEGEVTVISTDIDTKYHRFGDHFVKTAEDFESVKSLLATLVAKACGVACPNVWLVPIHFIHRLPVEEYENEKYVQEKVAPEKMGKQIAFNLFVGNSDQFYQMHKYLDPCSSLFLKDTLDQYDVNADNFSVRDKEIHSIDLSMEETNITRFLFREVKSEKMQYVLDELAEYLSYDKRERRQLEKSYVNYSKQWSMDRNIDHLWQLAQVYMNGFPFYYDK